MNHQRRTSESVQRAIDSMTLEKVEIAILKPWERNPRDHTEGIEALVDSIGYYGWTNPVLVQRGTNRVIAGHGRLEAARRAGLTVLPVIYLDYDDLQATAYTVADNALAERSVWNDELLTEVLEGLEAEDMDLSLTGLADDDLTDYLADDEDLVSGGSRKGALNARFGVPPFSVLDARAGRWQDRKRRWIALGIESELGRDAEVFASSAQPPGVYTLRNDMRARLGHDPTWDEILKEAKKRGMTLASGISIFDPVLTELAYSWFTPPGGHVLDPFAGGSVRGIVSAMLGRKYTGIDLRGEQTVENRKQWEAIRDREHLQDLPSPQWITGDSLEVLPTLEPEYDFVFSCPPYADLEVYSEDPRDLSHMAYTEFCTAYRTIIERSVSLLKHDRFACFVVSEIRDKQGWYRKFVNETIEAFEAAGARFYNDTILVTMFNSAAVRANRTFSAARKLVRVHQNVLLFCKGNPRTASTACGEVHVEWLEDSIVPTTEELLAEGE